MWSGKGEKEEMMDGVKRDRYKQRDREKKFLLKEACKSQNLN